MKNNFDGPIERGDVTQVARVIDTAGTHYLEPCDTVVKCKIPASGNIVLVPPKAAAYGNARILIHVDADAGAGNVSLDTTLFGTNLKTNPTFDNLTAIHDFWLFEVYFGLLVKMIDEDST